MNSPAHPTAATAPPPVRLAVKLVYARIAVTLLGLLLTVAYVDEAAAATAGGAAGAGTEFAGLAVGLGLAFSVLGAVVATALWVVLAIFTGRGHGWARIVLAVFAGLAVLSALLTAASLAISAATDLPSGIPPVLTVLLTVVSLALWAAIVVLLWRPASSAFFRASAAARAARAGHLA
jgi:hypothetical protein